MVDFSSYETISYNQWDMVWAVLFGGVAAFMFLAISFKSYRKDGVLDYFEKFIMGIGVLLAGIVILIGIPDLIEKCNWTYTFDESSIYLYNTSKSESWTEDALIKSAKFSELTPYFEYIEKGTIEDREIIANIYLKTVDGSDFIVIKANSLQRLANKYHPFHQKNPHLIERTIILKDEYSFKTFVDLLGNK